MDDFIPAAEILYPGKDGYLKINPILSFPDNFFSLNDCFVEFFDKLKKIPVLNFQRNKNSAFIRFKNFETERELQVFTGRRIFINKKNFNEWDLFQSNSLTGMKVSRSGFELGTVSEVLHVPANDVLVILTQSGEEILIPAVTAFIQEINPEEKRIILFPDAATYDQDDDEN